METAVITSSHPDIGPQSKHCIPYSSQHVKSKSMQSNIFFLTLCSNLCLILPFGLHVLKIFYVKQVYHGYLVDISSKLPSYCSACRVYLVSSGSKYPIFFKAVYCCGEYFERKDLLFLQGQ